MKTTQIQLALFFNYDISFLHDIQDFIGKTKTMLAVSVSG